MARKALPLLLALAGLVPGCDDAEPEDRAAEIEDYCELAEEASEAPAADDLVVESAEGDAFVCALEDYQAYLDAGGEPDPSFRYYGQPICWDDYMGRITIMPCPPPGVP